MESYRAEIYAAGMDTKQIGLQAEYEFPSIGPLKRRTDLTPKYQTTCIRILDKLIRQMVLYPEHLVIEEGVEDTAIIPSIRAHSSDTSHLIGKRAETFKALKEIGMAIARDIDGKELVWLGFENPVVGDNQSDRGTNQFSAGQMESLASDLGLRLFDSDETELRESGKIVGLIIRHPKYMTEFAGEMKPHLVTLFRAIGRMYERQIDVYLIPVEANDEQPKTAAGRFTKTRS